MLSSLKLATEFLAHNGTFVTKVFRSKDYNSLMWVFNQLFTKVEATKPPSSRNVSAEIFVVCTGYRAPKKIDPRLLDAKSVFEDLDIAAEDEAAKAESSKAGGAAPSSADVLTPAALNVFKPEKKRRAREGYDDGDLLLYKDCGAMDFVRGIDPIGVLGSVNRLRWQSDEDRQLLKHPLTTDEIRSSVEDLKVLGKRDFKTLLKWRSSVREDMGLEVKVKPVPESTEKVEVEELDEEEQIDQELAREAADADARRRRERRKKNEAKNREVLRMQLNMTTPMDLGMERTDALGDGDVFDLGEVEGKRGVRKGVAGGLNGLDEASDEEAEDAEEEDEEMSEVDSDEEDLSDTERKANRLEEDLDAAYDEYQNRKLERDTKFKVKQERRRRAAAEGGEWKGIRGEGSDESDHDDSSSDEDMPARRNDDLDMSDSEDDDSDSDESGTEELVARHQAKRSKAKSDRLLTTLKPEKKKGGDRATNMWFDQPAIKGMKGLDKLFDFEDEEPEAESDGEEDVAMQGALDDAALEVESDGEGDDSDDFESAFADEHAEGSDVEEEANMDAQEAAERAREQRIKDVGLTTAEAMTLAQQLVNREKTKTQLIDEGFNRHAFNVGGEDIPPWFLDDEQRHFRTHVPTTKEAVQALRERQRELNARPIKKIAEAKARKKMRTVRRLEKIRAKAQGINDNEEEGLTEKEKASSIAQILAKAGKKQPKKETKLVVAVGANRGIKGRPRGVKGRYKIVDPRMKKEMRAMKRIAKANKKRRK